MRKALIYKIGILTTFLSSLFFSFLNSRIVLAQSGSSSAIVLDPVSGPTRETFEQLNPLRIAGSSLWYLNEPGQIFTRILRFALPIGGVILFVMLIWGGFEILIGAAGTKSVDAGKQRIKAALIGYLLLFSSYWIMQIIQIIFGLIIV